MTASTSMGRKIGERHVHKDQFRRKRRARKAFLEILSFILSSIFIMYIWLQTRPNSAEADEYYALISKFDDSVEIVHDQCEFDVATLCAPASPFHFLSNIFTDRILPSNNPVANISPLSIDTVFSESFSPQFSLVETFFEDPFKFFDSHFDGLDSNLDGFSPVPPCHQDPINSISRDENVHTSNFESGDEPINFQMMDEAVNDISTDANSIPSETISFDKKTQLEYGEEIVPLSVENTPSKESSKAAALKDRTWTPFSSLMRRGLEGGDKEAPRRRLQASSPMFVLYTETFPFYKDASSYNEVYPDVLTSLSSVPLHYGSDIDQCLKQSFERTSNLCQASVISASKAYLDFESLELDLKRAQTAQMLENNLCIFALIFIGSLLLLIRFNKSRLRRRKTFFTRKMILRAVYNDKGLKEAVGRAIGVKLGKNLSCGDRKSVV